MTVGTFFRNAALAGTVAISTLAASASPTQAQQQPRQYAALPSIEDAGRVALETCNRLGIRDANCVRNERIRLENEIVRESACATELQGFRNNPEALARGRVILAGMTPSAYGTCRLLQQLRNG